MTWSHEVVQDNGPLGKFFKLTELVGEGEEPRVLHVAAMDEDGLPALIEVALAEPPSGPLPPTENNYRLAIQHHVDEAARSRRYDSGNSLASYVTSTNEAWAAEAQAFVAWRDAVWQHAYAELDKVVAGEREQPGVDDFIGELPVIEWPASTA